MELTMELFSSLSASLNSIIKEQTLLSSLLWIVFSSAFVYLYYENKYKRIKHRFNLKGPTPWPILGNLYSFLTTSRFATDLENFKKYGKIYIMFLGSSPRVVISDREVIHRITTKDFEIFSNHQRNVALINNRMLKALFFRENEQWKRLRALMSPTFTSSKIKRMYKLIDVCTEDLIDCIDEQIDATKRSDGRALIRTKEVMGLYTLDGIASCCYALKLNREKGQFSLEDAASRNELAKTLLKLFRVDVLRVLLAVALPKFLMQYLYRNKNQKEVTMVNRHIEKIIENRQKLTQENNIKHDDYLQILMDAKLDDKMELNENDDNENHHACLTDSSLRSDQEQFSKDAKSFGSSAKLTQEELMTNALVLLAVGLETTSVLLRNLCYALAFHPDIQEKLHAELNKIVTKNYSKHQDRNRYSFSYEDLTACAYLDAVICENLRYMTPISAMDRVAKEDYVIDKYNVHIPKGTVVFLSYGSVHRDPMYFPEPGKFDPERFMPVNRGKIPVGAYTPFGQGPRHCLGMRFSLTETKLALANVVMVYRFLPVPGDLWPPVPSASAGVTNYKTSNVLVERR